MHFIPKLFPILLLSFVGYQAISPPAATASRDLVPVEIIEGKPIIIRDGDSFSIEGQEHDIRLWGIQAPEIGEMGAEKAHNALIRLISNQRLSCSVKMKDTYKRSVALCKTSYGQDVGLELIKLGVAKEWKYFSKGYYSSLLNNGNY